MIRLQNLELLKAIALYFIIVCHLPDFPLRHTSAYAFVDQSLRFIVPLFFMISGYYFMRSWESSTTSRALLTRYGVRLFTMLLFWGYFYAVVPPLLTLPPPLGWQKAMHALWECFYYLKSFLLTGGITPHLWFVSSLLQALIILWACNRLGRTRLAIAVGAGFYCFGLLMGPYVGTPWGVHKNVDPKIGPVVSTLFVALGAWVAQSRWRPTVSQAWPLIALGFVCCMAENVFLHQVFHQEYISHDFLIGTVPYATGVLLLALALPSRRNPRWIAGISRHSLGIFILHPFFITILWALPWGREVLGLLPLLSAVLVLYLSWLTSRLFTTQRWLRSIA